MGMLRLHILDTAMLKSDEALTRPVVRAQHFHSWGPGLIPVQGTKVLQASQCIPHENLRVVETKVAFSLSHLYLAQLPKS